MDFILILSAAVSLLVLLHTLEIFFGYRKIEHLAQTSPILPNTPPKVSIIVSALNEAQTIEPALQSLLALEYPHLEIIAINDRSTDATPLILARMAQAHPKLRVLHISTLPAGWLGKNHALHQGAQVASGDYLLFTDADVIFQPDTLHRAVNYCEQQQVDHLALMFKLLADSHLLKMMILSFKVGFLSYFKPWKVGTSAKHFCGLGGFNLVRRSAYEGAGGHAALPMAVVDDMQLGKLMKTAGYRQHVLAGFDFVAVEWYPSVPAMVKGLQKNFFAGLDYKLSLLAWVTVLVLLLRVWPWAGLFLSSGLAWWCNLLAILSGLALYVDVLRRSDDDYFCLIFAPFVVWIELAMYWSATFWVLKRGGIEWRGTFYHLEELKRHV